MTKIVLRYAFNTSSWVPNKPEWLKAMSCIQNEERYRISSFAYQRDAKASMVGRLMIRRVVSELLDISNAEVRLERTDKGRPVLISTDLPHAATQLDFNISHQGDFTVLSAAFGLRTGVDVMKVHFPVTESVSEFFELMKRQFHDKEWGVIKGPQSSLEKMRLFYRHWCLKESYVKAIGVGIGVDLDQLVCQLSHDSEPFVSWTEQDENAWKFEEHSLDVDHVVAIAWNGPNVKSSVQYGKFVELTLSDLLANMSILHRAESNFWQNYKSKDALPAHLRDVTN